jgi:transcriptional regulator with XRE-family HTH domain
MKAARIAAGLTQTELGALLALERSSVANIEAGRQQQTAEQVILTANATGADPRWLLTGWEPERPYRAAGMPLRVVGDHIGALRHLADELASAIGVDDA